MRQEKRPQISADVMCHLLVISEYYSFCYMNYIVQIQRKKKLRLDKSVNELMVRVE